LNGCCYGGPSDLPWAVTFPKYSTWSADSQTAQQLSPPYADQAARGELHGFRLEARDGQPAVVARVDSNSPAEAAGLKAGDAVLAVDGEPIQSLTRAKDLILQNFAAERATRLTLGTGHSVEIPSVAPPPRSRPVHPAQIYSAVDAGILAWLLWSYYPLRRRDGELVALMLTIHPVTRFLLEVIRTDEQAVFGTGMSISQNISLLLLAVAGALWWYMSKQPRGVAWPLAAGPPSRNERDESASSTVARAEPAANGERSQPRRANTRGRRS
jgi:phosphatidylglycerol:prolipoprotein diacylglycerol transferase